MSQKKTIVSVNPLLHNHLFLQEWIEWVTRFYSFFCNVIPMKTPHCSFLFFLPLLLLPYQPLMAQKQLDSIVRYTYTTNGKDSLALAKTLFDYNSKGQLVSERILNSENFSTWTDELRTYFIYDTKGRIERINRDSFLTATSEWHTYNYAKRTYESDSQYQVHFYQRQGSLFNALPKRKRISSFSDSSYRSRVDLIYNDIQKTWIVTNKDSLVKNRVNGFITQQYNNGNLATDRVSHFSGANSNFFRLDSIVNNTESLTGKSHYLKYKTPPASRMIYRTRIITTQTAPNYVTADSTVYFLNSNGLPDSSHLHQIYWNAPGFNQISNKSFYTWKGNTQTSYSTGQVFSGSFTLWNKVGFDVSDNGLEIDTIKYQISGLVFEKDTRKRTILDKDGNILSLEYYNWSSIVDSFSLDEKELYFYTDLSTRISQKEPITLLKAWPNPTTGVVHLQNMPKGHLQLLDLQGRLITRLNASVGSSFFIKEKGAYLLKSEQTGQVVKIMVH